jgi:hypothetical protein
LTATKEPEDGGAAPHSEPELLPAALEEVEAIVRRPVWKRARVMIPLWIAILVLLRLGVHHDVDGKLLAGGVVIVGLASNAFAWLMGLIGLVPFVGPLIVKVLAIPFIWLLNAIGYLVSFVAIRRGYSRDVLTYRGLTIALLIGVGIGFVLAKIF